MKKREFLPHLITCVAIIFFILIVFSVPPGKFLGIELRMIVLLLLGILAYKIFDWTRALFSEMPP